MSSAENVNDLEVLFFSNIIQKLRFRKTSRIKKLKRLNDAKLEKETPSKFQNINHNLNDYSCLSIVFTEVVLRSPTE